jgi:hypothetical protein
MRDGYRAGRAAVHCRHRPSRLGRLCRLPPGTRIPEAGPVGLAFPRVRGPGTGVGPVAPGGDAPEATEAQDTTTGSSRQVAASRAPAPLRSRGIGDHSSPLGGVRHVL